MACKRPFSLILRACVYRSMKQLRDRVMKLKEDSDHIYHLSRTEGKPTINWGSMMDEKQVRGTTPHTQGLTGNVCDPPLQLQSHCTLLLMLVRKAPCSH